MDLRVSPKAALQPQELERALADGRLAALLRRLEGCAAADLPSETQAARAVPCSESTLKRHLREALELDYRALHRRLVMAAARDALFDGARPIKEIARASGYGSHRAFGRAFLKDSGLTPGEFRARRAR